MKLNALLLLCAGSVLLSATAASATTISDFTGSVSSTSPTQTGRLSRNGVPQSWTGGESYPGAINTTTTYRYQTYTFAASLFTGGQYVEITEFAETGSVNVFVSAYAGSYSPGTSFQTGWLGDEGSSGNSFGNPTFFDIYLPVGQNLVLVLNNTGANGLGVGDLIDLTVDSYSDTDYDEPVVAVATTPEPSSLMLLGTGALTLAGAVRRRLAK